MATSRASLCIYALTALALITGCKKDLAHRVQDRIRQSDPDIVVTIRDSSTLDVKAGEQKVTVSLDNVATICKNEPDHCDDAIDRVVKNASKSRSRVSGSMPTP